MTQQLSARTASMLLPLLLPPQVLPSAGGADPDPPTAWLKRWLNKASKQRPRLPVTHPTHATHSTQSSPSAALLESGVSPLGPSGTLPALAGPTAAAAAHQPEGSVYPTEACLLQQQLLSDAQLLLAQPHTGSAGASGSLLSSNDGGFIQTEPYEPQNTGSSSSRSPVSLAAVPLTALGAAGAFTNHPDAGSGGHHRAMWATGYTAVPTGSSSSTVSGPGAVSWPLGLPTGASLASISTSTSISTNTVAQPAAASGDTDVAAGVQVGFASGRLAGQPGRHTSDESGAAAAGMRDGEDSASPGVGPTAAAIAMGHQGANSGGGGGASSTSAGLLWAITDAEARQPLLPKH